MDDKHIEESLRNSWSPRPPEGMKTRILAKAREATEPRRHPLLGLLRWKPALAMAATLVVLLTGLSDQARQSRMQAMIGGGQMGTGVTAPLDGLRRKDFDQLLARGSSVSLWRSDMKWEDTP